MNWRMTGWSVALAMMVIGASASAAGSSCTEPTIQVRGVVHYVAVEGGCWQFVSNAGQAYEPINGPYYMYCDGVEGTLVGCPPEGVVSTCQTGTLIEVLRFEPDPFTVHGTSHFVDVEGGCWQFVSDSGMSYEPAGGPPELFVEGATGTMTAFELCGLGSFCQVGTIVQVIDYAPDAGKCPPDLNGDGNVGIDDLITLLLAWGSPGGDVTGDGTTDIVDLVVLLLSWGPC